MCQPKYGYMWELRVMDGREPGRAQSTISECLSGINTPLVVDEWEKVSSHHPNREYGGYHNQMDQ